MITAGSPSNIRTDETRMPGSPMVEMRDISKRYPERTSWANRQVSLDLKRGEILCLAGENGAGKTTLMKILYGLTAPTEGEILVKGRKVIINSPLAANRLGIGMVHQHFMLFPELTVSQNVVMGIEPVRFGLFYDTTTANHLVRELIEQHHFSVRPQTPVGELTVGEMQQVEILKMLYRNVDILILDEPTAVLTDQEIAALFRTFKVFAESGKSLILITHKLKEIKAISDRVAIMRQGEMLGVKDTKTIDEFEISRLMVGKGVELWNDRQRESAETRRTGGPQPEAPQTGEMPVTAPPGPPPPKGGLVITLESGTVERRGQARPLLDHISFSARAGEILAFAGVGGNGLGVLEAVLGGFLPISSGRILLLGEDISRLKTRQLRKRGLAYVPADRLGVGSAQDALVWEHLAVNRRREVFGWRSGPLGSANTRQENKRRVPFLLDSKAVSRFAADLIKRYDIAGNEGLPLRALSGGNIQKLILAREIDQYRDYIVFSEPAWGLDVSASRYVYEQITGLRDRGAAVILISSNLDEILSIADRIIVLYRGSIAAEFSLPRNSNTVKYDSITVVNDSNTVYSDMKTVLNLDSIKEEIGACMMGLKYSGTAGQEAPHG
jgi:simple sugar transport system ATP-binding protein